MAVEETLDLNLSPLKAKAVAREVNAGIRSAQTARAAMDDRIAGYWERYELKAPNRRLSYAQEPNIRAPLTLWVVDGIWVRMMRTVFGQLPYLRVDDEDPASPPEGLPIQVALQHLADTDLSLRFRGGQLFLNGLIEGTAVGKLVRDESRRRVRDRERSAFGMFGSRLVERDVIDKKGLSLDVIDLKDFQVAHPAVVDIDRQPWVAHRVWLTWDEMVARQDDGRFPITKAQLDALRPLGKKRRQADTFHALDDVKATLDRAEDVGWTQTEEWEVWEAEWRYDFKDNGRPEEAVFAVLANWDEFPLRASKYPFWNGRRNYVVYRPKPRINRFYGRSTAAEVQGLQDEADARLNQDLSAKSIAVLAGLTPILPRSMQREWERHKWELLKPIYVDAPEQFRTLAEVIGDFREMDPDLDRIFMMAERVSGMSDPQLGKPAEGSKTAYEIATVTQEGNIKFAQMIEETQEGNKELGYQVLEHAYQLALESPAFAARLAKVCGEDPFAGTSLADIRARWMVIPTGNTLVANREAEAQKWIQIKTLMAKSIFVQANPKHMWYLDKRVLQALGLDREIEQIIGKEEQVDLFAELVLGRAAAAGDTASQVQLNEQEEVPAEAGF